MRSATHPGVEAHSLLAEMRIDAVGDCGVECQFPYRGQFLLVDLDHKVERNTDPK
jgi:hypothetical protein